MAYNPVDARAASLDLDAPSVVRHSEYGSTYAIDNSSRGVLNTQPYRDDPDNGVPMAPIGRYAGAEKNGQYGKAPPRKRGVLILVVILVLIALILAIVLPVYFVVIRPKQLNTSGGSSSGAGSISSGNGQPAATTAPGASPSSTPGENLAITGGDGSIVTMEDGTKFTYNNTFGGYWVWDESAPFNSGAKAQAASPGLNETWKWGDDKIYGVNLGGWLTLEPFITPAIFEKYPGSVDEWTLSVAMAADTASGGLNQIEDHYKTFITEKDFAEIAGAGLNWVRISLPFWSIEKTAEEPFLEKVAWNYFLKAVQWARKYGIRINLDLHTLPGSQNGWNHSGRLGSTNVLNGTMGLANAQRSLNYIRTLAQFISQPQYSNVVPFFGVINEPNGINAIPQDTLTSMYVEIYNMIRNDITGVGNGVGPMISIHDAFLGISKWSGSMAGADRLALDNHNYFAFSDPLPGDVDAFIPRVCAFADMYSNSLSSFGLTTIGEWSNAINDCGLYVNNVGAVGTRYEGNYLGATGTPMGSCDDWNNYSAWTATRKANFKQYMLTSMEVYEHAFFWTWKIGPSSTTGKVEAPLWSYQLGLQEGWSPTDPRAAVGACAANGSPVNTFPGPLKPWQTGGAGPGLAAADVAAHPWPPVSFTTIPNVAALPTFTQTGPIITMPVPTFTKPGTTETIDAGSGWFNAQDTKPFYAPVTGCTYPDTWAPADNVIPPACPVAARRAPAADARPAPTAR